MNKVFTKYAFEDYKYLKQNHKKLAKKVEELLEDIEKNPYKGLGKPEALRNEFSGYWSRRINKEHRLVYKVDYDVITVIACRYHYSK